MFDSYSSSSAQKGELGHFALGPILLGPHSVRGPTVNRVSYAREKFRESTLFCIPVENFHDSNNTLLIRLEFKMYQRKSFATMTWQNSRNFPHYYYQIYQLGTGRHTQKAQACPRCLAIAKEPRS